MMPIPIIAPVDRPAGELVVPFVVPSGGPFVTSAVLDVEDVPLLVVIVEENRPGVKCARTAVSVLCHLTVIPLALIQFEAARTVVEYLLLVNVSVPNADIKVVVRLGDGNDRHPQ